MKTNITSLLRVVSGLALGLAFMAGVANAQPPAPTSSPNAKKPTTTNTPTETIPTSATVGEDAGDYTVTSTLEFGYRGIRVDGDVNKYKSDLNYKAGPRLFDSSLLLKAKDGKGGLFDSLLVTTTGWGADPSGHMRISVEKPEWYRFDGSYRRFKYYRFLNNFANPNWLFGAITVPPNPTTGQHGYNTRTAFGDFDLTILPKNKTIRFTVGYSPERYSGVFFTNYHTGGNEFQMLANARTRANDFRIGADGKLGPIDWTFLQGFRRFRDDTFIDTTPLFINPSSSVARYATFFHDEPTRGKVNYTRFSVHTSITKKLDITGRILHSRATSDSTFLETFSGTNFNTRITGALAPPNVLVLGTYNIPSHVERPNTLADLGVTFLATDKLRISNSFRVEDFTIDGIATLNDFFRLTRGAIVDTRSFSGLSQNKITEYRKYQNTLEGDYQFSKNYSIHLGYRYGSRREEQSLTGYSVRSNAPTLQPPFAELETNHTHAFLGGFKMRPVSNWTVYFDAEHGTADNVFTRIGNYNYTNIRAKSRYAPNRKINFNLALITRDNSNPSEIAGELLTDFGVNVKSRTFTSSIDWTPHRASISAGYNYNWVNSDAVVDYSFQVPPAASVRHFGQALYFMRNNFFYVDVVARLAPRVTLYSSYRINKDNGQGDRVADPAGIPGTLITSYPMSFQSPEARLAIRLNRRLDWNLGYQYYNYYEDNFLRTFPGSPRAQNYHAHLPYTSLRVYLGRRE